MTKSTIFRKLKINNRYVLDDGNEYILIGIVGTDTQGHQKHVVLVDDVNWKRRRITHKEFLKIIK